MKIRTVAVIGAGTMGHGIAQTFASKEFDVVLIDKSKSQLDLGLRKINESLKKLAIKEVISDEQVESYCARVTTASSISAVSNADLVIEAATESLEIKQEIFRTISQLAKDDCILCSNTSAISITQLSQVTSLPENLIGLHFMNPVPLMTLVEIIPGLLTSKATLETMVSLVEMLGKTPVASRDSPGFIANRLLIPMINEAVFLLQENIANAEDIDTAMKLGMGHPMGPLALADLIGLDIVLSIMEVLHKDLGEAKYRPASLLKRMVQANKLGKKTCCGFYSY